MQVIVAIVWVLLLPLPAQELPVELGTPEQSIAETASISCQSASLGHTDAEDTASEARVQDGHSAHDAGLMSEVNLKIDAEVAIGDEVVLVKGLAFHGRQRIVKQSLVNELGSTGSGLVRRPVDIQGSHVGVEL